MTRNASGFTLIEVLVALVIIAVGLLGIAGLQTRAQQAEMESYQRAQALMLVQDMADRIRANPGVGPCYNVTDSATGTPYAGVGSTATFECVDAGVNATQDAAEHDLTQWHRQLQGTSETMDVDGTTINVGAMIGARGCISYTEATETAPEFYTISVAWQGLAPTFASASTCATGLYTDQSGNVDDRLRRVVSITVRNGEGD